MIIQASGRLGKGEIVDATSNLAMPRLARLKARIEWGICKRPKPPTISLNPPSFPTFPATPPPSEALRNTRQDRPPQAVLRRAHANARAIADLIDRVPHIQDIKTQLGV